MAKVGLHRVKKTVRGRGGKTYQRAVMVRAQDAPKNSGRKKAAGLLGGVLGAVGGAIGGGALGGTLGGAAGYTSARRGIDHEMNKRFTGAINDRGHMGPNSAYRNYVHSANQGTYAKSGASGAAAGAVIGAVGGAITGAVAGRAAGRALVTNHTVNSNGNRVPVPAVPGHTFGSPRGR